MNDRFKFRVWDKRRNKFIESPEPTPLLQANGLLAYFKDAKYMNNYVIQFCTGLKDKNGKLIYEADIVKYAEFDWTDFSFKDWETEIAQVVWGNTYDNYYPAFDLKDTDFDGTNAFAYLFNEGWTVEVIGNIYQDSHLIENWDIFC